VAENDKQRFSLIHISAAPSSKAAVPADDAATATTSDIPQATQDEASNDPADYLIRANQGHSLAVDSDGLLTPISMDDLPETVVHGTTHSAWNLIVSTGGLKKMGRTHVHFASGLPAGFKTIAETESAGDGETTAQPPVISGMRKTSSILVFLDIKKAMEAGLKFWRSENGVILSEGDENGIISLHFFLRAEDRTGGLGILVQDGVVVKEAPESWAQKGNGKRGGRRGGDGGSGSRGQSS
jgi:2'-phosphotransferase